MATAAKTSLLKSGFVNWFLDPKIKTFFQNNSFFFQTQVYQNRWPIEALKKQKNAFLFISIYQTFTRSGKLLGKFQDFFKNSRLCGNPENEFAFFQTLVHLFLLMRMSNVGKFPWSWFLGDGTQREKNCCCLFISSITHEIRHFHVAMTYQNSVLSKTYCFFDVFNVVVIFIAKAP